MYADKQSYILALYTECSIQIQLQLPNSSHSHLQELEVCRSEASGRAEEVKTVKRENRKRRKIIEAYQDMLSQGATGLHPVRQQHTYMYMYTYTHVLTASIGLHPVRQQHTYIVHVHVHLYTCTYSLIPGLSPLSDDSTFDPWKSYGFYRSMVESSINGVWTSTYMHIVHCTFKTQNS